MKIVRLLIAALAISSISYAQTWSLDKAHSKLGFTITHLSVSDVDGLFKNFDANIQSSKPDFSDAVFTVTAKTNSVFTDDDQRDQHLRSADFFDADKYPEIQFKSKSIKKIKDNQYKLMGELTMHGVTKPVQLDLVLRGQTTHPVNKKQIAAFRVTGTIKRSDFKIAESTPSVMLSDEVELVANGEFLKG